IEPVLHSDPDRLADAGQDGVLEREDAPHRYGGPQGYRQDPAPAEHDWQPEGVDVKPADVRQTDDQSGAAAETVGEEGEAGGIPTSIRDESGKSRLECELAPDA